MFDALEYSKTVALVLTGIKAVYSCSGLASLEEMLQNLRNPATPVMVVEDSSDGYLSLLEGNFANEFNTVYFFDRVKPNDSADRRRAQLSTFALAKLYFAQMAADAVNFGDAAYGFDLSRIDYQKIGPIGNNFYGYSFSFTVRDENFNLVPPVEE